MKIVYHIPMFYQNGSELLAAFKDDFEYDLIKSLHKLGVIYIQQQIVQVEMNGHLVDELLLIFFADTVSDFSKMFIDMVSKYHSDLCQSVYYYEFGSNIVAISGVV